MFLKVTYYVELTQLKKMSNGGRYIIMNYLKLKIQIIFKINAFVDYIAWLLS